MNSNEGTYTFLDILSEGELSARGINLADKNLHYIYREVLDRSTYRKAARRDLFTLDTVIADVPELTRQEKKRLLQWLIDHNAIAQIIRLDSEPGDMGLSATSCFIGLPTENKDLVFSLFRETLSLSTEAVSNIVDRSHPVTVERITEDLVFDWHRENPPAENDLKYCLLPVFTALDLSAYEIIPPIELLTTTTLHLKRTLLDAKKIVEIPGMGLAPHRSDDVLIRYEAAVRFFNESILPAYEKNPDVRRVIEKDVISSIESEASATEDAVASPVSLASAVRATHLSEKSGRRDAWFPGYLTVQMILEYAGPAREKYNQISQNKRESEYKRIKGLIEEENLPVRGMRLLKQDEVEEIDPNVLLMLSEDPDLLHTVVFFDNGAGLLFVPSDFQRMKSVLGKLVEKGVFKEEIVLSIRDILERKADFQKRISQSSEFQEFLDVLLFQVAINRLSLFFRWMAKIGLFRQQLMEKGLALIENGRMEKFEKTAPASSSIQERFVEPRESEKKGREPRKKGVDELILSRLDEYYKGKEDIPSVDDIFRSFEKIEFPTFLKEVQKHRFQIIPMEKDAPIKEAVLFYPVDLKWHGRISHTVSLLERIMQEGEGVLQDPARLNRYKRARALNRQIVNIESKQSDASREAADHEAYERLRRLLKKYR